MSSKHDQAVYPLLVPMHGALDKKPRPLDRDVVTIGRARGCDIGLDAPDISTLHCMIYRGRDGLRLRDCGSRVGTRLNGLAVTNNLLGDGDVVQIGPFSFGVQIPAGHSAVRKMPEWPKVAHWNHSRRNFARLALNLRRRLCLALASPEGAILQELDHKAAALRAKIHDYDQRGTQLEAAERELEQDRHTLNRGMEEHREHVRHVENDLALRLKEADQEIHAKWLAFQDRCRQEKEQQRNHHKQNQEPEEIAKMNELRAAEQVAADALLEKQRAALAQADASLREQRTELGTMMADLRELQQAIRSQHTVDVHALTRENEELRALLAELEHRLISPSGPNGAASPPEIETLKAENLQLKQLVQERDQLLEEIRQQNSLAPGVSGDLESYETELNQYRQQLESDRAKLNAEIDQLRTRNQEMDDAIRDMEMSMSRERAELGRERSRLDRLRDEVRAELERMQREAAVRETMAPVQKLRDEMNQKKQGLNDRLKSLRTRLADPA